jgi:phosphoesterase RecJ-like protein
MNQEIKEQILQKIKDYHRIILSRHIRPDGDAIGSTRGLAGIIRATWPDKEVYVVNQDMADYLSFLGPDDVAPEDALWGDALAIVVDTATEERISNDKIHLCREIVKIDHHIDVKPFGDLSWVEDGRSSACEMVADFYVTFKDQLVLNRESATFIYLGMVTDSCRFRYPEVSGETLRYAAVMLDTGIDTEHLYAQLYLKDVSHLTLQAYVLRNMKMTENGVATIYFSTAMQKRYGFSEEEVGSAVSFLDSIRGSLIWMAFIEHEDAEKGKIIRVRLRSRFVAINSLAEKNRGGGHAGASGATLYNRREVNALIQEADQLLKDYKETHEGWL